MLYSKLDDGNVDDVQRMLVGLVVRARLPSLWLNSALTRAYTQRLIAQSAQYFAVRGALVEHMRRADQRAHALDVRRMLGDELQWFVCFTPADTDTDTDDHHDADTHRTTNRQHLARIDNILLSGHLGVTRALLTCEDVLAATKRHIGRAIIGKLVRTYLFPAACILANDYADTAADERETTTSNTQVVPLFPPSHTQMYKWISSKSTRILLLFF